ncbi:MAG: family 16 glycosylhydrolase [Saprospiraceae bacterium]
MKLQNRFLLFYCLCFTALFLQSCGTSEEVRSIEIQPVWSDEFDYEGLPDSNKWSYDVGDGCPKVCGWGNNELEYYKSNSLKNSRVENGILTIEAHREDFDNKTFTSARLVSKYKGDWLHGKIKIRAKTASGLGTWSAIWMLPTDNEYGTWPNSGEIDIMEHVGYNPDTVFGTVHTKSFNHMIGTEVGDNLFVSDADEVFHIYSVEWDKDKIDFFIDDQKYFTFKNENKTFAEYPFDKKFHLILNLAVGGNWGGKMGVDDSVFPQKMQVDYVRVYDLNQKDETEFLSKK